MNSKTIIEKKINTITDIMDIEADQDNRKVILPDATLSETGRNFLINNISANSFKIFKNDAVSELITIAGG